MLQNTNYLSIYDDVLRSSMVWKPRDQPKKPKIQIFHFPHALRVNLQPDSDVHEREVIMHNVGDTLLHACNVLSHTTALHLDLPV